MERDAVIGYGASGILIERFKKLSDHYQTHVCPKCGLIGTIMKFNDYKVCEKCKIDEDPACKDCKIVCTLCCKMCEVPVDPIDIPYASKLLFQELMAIGVAPHIKLGTL